MVQKLSEKYDKYFVLKIYLEPGETLIKMDKKSKGFTAVEMIGMLTRMIHKLNVIVDKREERTE